MVQAPHLFIQRRASYRLRAWTPACAGEQLDNPARSRMTLRSEQRGEIAIDPRAPAIADRSETAVAFAPAAITADMSRDG